MERNALTLYHREEHTMEQVRKQYSGERTSGGGSKEGSGGGGSSSDQATADQIRRLVSEELRKKAKGAGKDSTGAPKGGSRGVQEGDATAPEGS